jgi:hypothetical protein
MATTNHGRNQQRFGSTAGPAVPVANTVSHAVHRVNSAKKSPGMCGPMNPGAEKTVNGRTNTYAATSRPKVKQNRPGLPPAIDAKTAPMNAMVKRSASGESLRGHQI